MKKYALSKRDVMLLSTMLVLAIVFVVLGLLAPRRTPRLNTMESRSQPVASSRAFLGSHGTTPSSSSSQRMAPTDGEQKKQVPQGEQAVDVADSPVPQPEVPVEAQEEAIPVEQEPDTANMTPDEYHTWAKSVYPSRDWRRLLPREREHHDQLAATVRELGHWRRTWVNESLPFEEWMALDEEYTRRLGRTGGQINYYLNIVFDGWGDDYRSRGAPIINPHTEGDLAGEE